MFVQVHRSPGFITSNLIGKKDDGTIIKGGDSISIKYTYEIIYIIYILLRKHI